MLGSALTPLRERYAHWLQLDAQQVLDDRDELIVTRRNREPVVVMPLSDWEGMQETLHLLSSPANAERLRASMAELDAGKGFEREPIEP